MKTGYIGYKDRFGHRLYVGDEILLKDGSFERKCTVEVAEWCGLAAFRIDATRWRYRENMRGWRTFEDGVTVHAMPGQYRSRLWPLIRRLSAVTRLEGRRE